MRKGQEGANMLASPIDDFLRLMMIQERCDDGWQGRIKKKRRTTTTKTTKTKTLQGRTHYCEEISTRCRGSLGRWPTPVEVQDLLAVRQFEHGQSLSQRIYMDRRGGEG